MFDMHPIELDFSDPDRITFDYDGDVFDMGDFRSLRSPWGDAPNADALESQGIVGWQPRGAGNADTYMYVVAPDEAGDWLIGLVDSVAL